MRGRACPECGSEKVEWDSWQDDPIVDGVPFIEQAHVCTECGWCYSWLSRRKSFTANQSVRLGLALPDPFEDAVPMAPRRK